MSGLYIASEFINEADADRKTKTNILIHDDS